MGFATHRKFLFIIISVVFSSLLSSFIPPFCGDQVWSKWTYITYVMNNLTWWPLLNIWQTRRGIQKPVIKQHIMYCLFLSSNHFHCSFHSNPQHFSLCFAFLHYTRFNILRLLRCYSQTRRKKLSVLVNIEKWQSNRRVRNNCCEIRTFETVQTQMLKMQSGN